MAEWRPVSTAPKDGSNVLLCVAGHVTVGGWLTRADQGVDDDDPRIVPEGWWTLDCYDKEPTHWMPLPAPPEPETDEA